MSATITSQDQMGQALEQLGRLYHALAALRQRVEPANPRNFAVLAEGHIDEIRRLQRVLDEYAGAVAAEEQSAPLWLRVVGRDIEWQAAPTSVLTAILDAFRKGVQSVAELLLTGDLATRPTAALKRATDFRVVCLAPGSLRVGVRLPSEEGDTANAVAGALVEYLTAAAWVGSQQPEEDLQQRIPDGRRRKLILTELARLIPRERGLVDEVEFSGSLLRSQRIAGRVMLSRASRARINDTLDRIAEQRVENYEGDLREIDLDNCSFILRNAGMTPGEGLQLECQFPEELLEAAKEALDKRVQVTGSRAVEKGRRARPLVVNRIEILEDRAE